MQGCPFVVQVHKEKKALFREMLETSPLALNRNETGYERS